MRGAIGVRRRDLLEHGQRARPPERHHFTARLELAEEQDVVDQVAGRVDLLTGLLHELVDVRARKRRGLEQHEQSRERGAELVRDRSREPGPQLLIGGKLRQIADVEHERAADILSDPPAAHGLPQGVDSGRARRHQPPLAVQHDDGLGKRGHKRSNPFLVGYHPFTTHSPSIDP